MTRETPGLANQEAIRAHLAATSRRQNAEHEALIDKVDVSGAVKSTECNYIPNIKAKTMRQLPNGGIWFLNRSNAIEFMYSSTSLDELPFGRADRLKLKSGEELDRVEFSPSHTVAYSVHNSDRIRIVYADDDEPIQQVKSIGSPQFGFSGDGHLYHVAPNGVIMKDGEPSGLNQITPRLLRKDKAVPVMRMSVSGDKVTYVEKTLDRDYEDFRTEPALWVNPNQDTFLPRFWFSEYALSLADEANNPVLYLASNFSSSHVDQVRFPIRIQADGSLTAIYYHIGDPMADGFCYTPSYDMAAFYGANGEPLGAQKVKAADLNPDLLTVLNGFVGVIGKPDGSVELVDLKKRPDGGKLYPRVSSNSWVTEDEETKRQTAHFSHEVVGDPYPYRVPPTAIRSWKAHDHGIVNVFQVPQHRTDNRVQLITVDTIGMVQKWEIDAEKAFAA